MERRQNDHRSAREKRLAALYTSVRHVSRQVDRVERKTDAVPEPARNGLKDRVLALKVQRDALWRNFGEVSEDGGKSARNLEQVEELSKLLDRDSRSLSHEAEFLAMGSRTTLDLLAEGVSKAFGSIADRHSGVPAGKGTA